MISKYLFKKFIFLLILGLLFSCASHEEREIEVDKAGKDRLLNLIGNKIHFDNFFDIKRVVRKESFLYVYATSDAVEQDYCRMSKIRAIVDSRYRKVLDARSHSFFFALKASNGCSKNVRDYVSSRQAYLPDAYIDQIFKISAKAKKELMVEFGENNRFALERVSFIGNYEGNRVEFYLDFRGKLNSYGYSVNADIFDGKIKILKVSGPRI